MKTTGFKILLVASLGCVLACGENRSKEEFAEDSKGVASRSVELSMDSVAATSAGLTRADNPNQAPTKEENHFNTAVGLVLKDTSRKIIRSADIKFEVKNLLTASKTLEDKVIGLDGFVLSTQIRAENEERETKALGDDSLLVIKSYDHVNNLVVRVPTQNLRTFLQEIFPLVHYLNYRNIGGEDVTVNILAEKMKTKRLDAFGKQTRQNIDKKGKKLRETQESESELLEKQEEADRSRLAILDLADRLEYSTLRIEMYQQNLLSFNRIANVNNTEAYEPGFLSKLGKAFKNGWDLLKGLVLFLASIWSLIALAIGMIFLILWLNKSKSKPA